MLAIKSELLELLRRNDLLRSALLAGRIEDAAFNETPALEIIMELASRVWTLSARKRENVFYKVERLNTVLFKEFQLQAKSDRYKQVIDDPDRYYLHTVLTKKVASPFAINLIYMIVADQVGIPYECVALPSYYLLRVKDKDEEIYIDPFDSGKILGPEEVQKKFKAVLQRHRVISTSLFEKVGPTQLVARLIQQLKHIYILKGKAVEALRAVEMLTVIFPHSPELTRDRGILYCEMEYFSRAMKDLKYYLHERPNAEDVREIKKLTHMLKGYREVVN